MNTIPSENVGEWTTPQRRGAPRIHVLLAREAPVAVIFRRGPAKQVQLIKWDLAKDTFECGQWLKAKIDYGISDLSPDGKLLVCFALRHHGKVPSWTAISRPPYFTALSFFPISHIHGGGGEFLSNREICLYHPRAATTAVNHRLGNLRVIPWVPRLNSMDWLERDGWTLIREPNYRLSSDNSFTWTAEPPRIWRKSHPRMKLTLELESGSLRRDCGLYRVLRKNDCEWFRVLADWANWDAKGALLFARNGKIFRALPRHTEMATPVERADFSKNKFTKLPPPEWATRW